MPELDDFMDSFDDLVQMAQHSPADFESYRNDLIEDLISKLPSSRQQRMRRFQWRIDQERRRHKNELASCIKLMGMMMDSFDQLQGQFAVLDQVLGGATLETRPKKKAQVLQLAAASLSN